LRVEEIDDEEPYAVSVDGTWTLDGASVTIEFSTLEATFTGLFSGDRLTIIDETGAEAVFEKR